MSHFTLQFHVPRAPQQGMVLLSLVRELTLSTGSLQMEGDSRDHAERPASL